MAKLLPCVCTTTKFVIYLKALAQVKQFQTIQDELDNFILHFLPLQVKEMHEESKKWVFMKLDHRDPRSVFSGTVRNTVT